MIKKIAIVSIVSLGLSTSLFSQEIYVKLGLGTASVKGDNNTSIANDVDFTGESILTVAVGTKIEEFDIEVEYTYEKNKWRNVDTNVKGSGKTNNLMINGFYNLNVDSDFTPYAGLGLGSAKFDSGVNDETYFVYQTMLGVNYALTKEFDLALEYRYKGTNSDNDLSSNNILFVTKYKF